MSAHARSTVSADGGGVVEKPRAETSNLFKSRARTSQLQSSIGQVASVARQQQAEGCVGARQLGPAPLPLFPASGSLAVASAQLSTGGNLHWGQAAGNCTHTAAPWLQHRCSFQPVGKCAEAGQLEAMCLHCCQSCSPLPHHNCSMGTAVNCSALARFITSCQLCRKK